MATEPRHIGQRVSYDGAVCTIRFVGEVAGTAGSWLGVEWDDASRGKHDGSHKGVRYFTCLSKSPTVASFVRPARPADAPRTFIDALNAKYVSEDTSKIEGAARSQIVISGKVAEEMGFDKIRKRQAQVQELKVVILDRLCVTTSTGTGAERIGEICPKIVQLDLSRNLFQSLSPIVEVCGELKALRKLGISGNRFENVLSDETLSEASTAFKGVRELELYETLLGWDEICHIAGQCSSLTSLHAGTNQLSLLPPIHYGGLSSTLTTLNLEFNDFTNFSDLGSLTALMALRNLHLKGNNIQAMAAPGQTAPVFPVSLQYLDVSYNDIQNWSFVDHIPTHFPGLTGLRLAHNPVYDRPDSETNAPSSEESHMFTIGRVGQLMSLNFTAIKLPDRANAEMFYLSRIAKQLATVPESAQDTILTSHPRYPELCEIYGEPDIIRRQEVNPSFLEARLVTVRFHSTHSGKKVARIPKSFDIYAVKGVAGRLFKTAPLKLRLVWETGEWDPVAGFDEVGEDGSDEEDEVQYGTEPGIDPEEEHDSGGEEEDRYKSGRWVKREVELNDGPKQLGYCVDGLDIAVRVEMAQR